MKSQFYAEIYYILQLMSTLGLISYPPNMVLSPGLSKKKTLRAEVGIGAALSPMFLAFTLFLTFVAKIMPVQQYKHKGDFYI